MLVKDLPTKLSDKTFENLQDLLLFIYDNQIITEFGEIPISQLNTDMLRELDEAKKLQKKDFVNI